MSDGQNVSEAVWQLMKQRLGYDDEQFEKFKGQQFDLEIAVDQHDVRVRVRLPRQEHRRLVGLPEELPVDELDPARVPRLRADRRELSRRPAPRRGGLRSRPSR